MPACSVTGAIFGDEGKGKTVDVVAEEADLVVRYMGGNNAGHTVVIDKDEYVTHVMPTGVLQGKKCAIAAGVVLDPRQLAKEFDELEEFKPNLIIDPRTHIIMPYHNILDKARENLRKKKVGVKIGTTGRGIGPVHGDRSTRFGIRFFDLINKKRLEDKLDIAYKEPAFLLKEFYGLKPSWIKKIIGPLLGKSYDKIPSKKEIFDQYRELGERLKPYLGDISRLVMDYLGENKNVLFEGAQGTLLDIFYGNYPRVTSSHPMTGDIYTDVGIPDSIPIHHIGVLKAYMTKVGSGPLVTGLDNGNWPVNEEESDPMAIKIRAKGNEKGATTGRLRRIGWLDLVAVNYSCRLNGFDELAITKLDVLEDIKPKVAIAYVHDKKHWTKDFEAWDLEYLEKCKPFYYCSFDKFNNLVDYGYFDKLVGNGKINRNAQHYIDFISMETGIPVNFISTGPGRDEYILKEKKWWSK